MAILDRRHALQGGRPVADLRDGVQDHRWRRLKEHRFIRADKFADEEGGADHAILKGQQIVDQMGDRIFS